MRETLTQFDRRIFWRSEGGGYTRIPDQAKSTQNHNYITPIASKDHSGNRSRHYLDEGNIAHYHIKTVPAPAPEALTTYFSTSKARQAGLSID